MIAKFLPKLRRLEFRQDSWELDGFVRCMDSLSDHADLKELDIASFPGYWLARDSGAYKTFKCLIGMTSLHKLGLSFPRGFSPRLNILTNMYMGDMYDISLQVLGEGLEHNADLGILELTGMNPTKSHDLLKLLVGAKSPKELVLRDLSIKDKVERHYNQPATPNGRIESLTFVDCPAFQENFENLLYDVTWMPMLKILKLHFGASGPGTTQLASVNITEPLIAILNLGVLEMLDVASSLFGIEFGKLCDALSDNSSLRVLLAPAVFAHDDSLKSLLSILKKSNVTLVDCGLQPAGRHDNIRDNVIRLLRLNKFGRGKVRSESATKGELLEFIRTVSADTSLQLTIDKFNITYGLLRQNPYVWCEIET